MWNAAFLVSGGKTIGHYDKIRLVPFGEYVPLRKMLFFAEKLVHAVGRVRVRHERHAARRHASATVRRSATRSSIPQITRTQVRNGANVLVTITNDAWYDGTSAPRAASESGAPARHRRRPLPAARRHHRHLRVRRSDRTRRREHPDGAATGSSTRSSRRARRRRRMCGSAIGLRGLRAWSDRS